MKIENMTFVFISVYHMFPSPSTVFVFLTPPLTRMATVSNHCTLNTTYPEGGIIYSSVTSHLFSYIRFIYRTCFAHRDHQV
jgi:hypothetical protein